jgi:hypothetical protein
MGRSITEKHHDTSPWRSSWVIPAWTKICKHFLRILVKVQSAYHEATALIQSNYFRPLQAIVLRIKWVSVVVIPIHRGRAGVREKLTPLGIVFQRARSASLSQDHTSLGHRRRKLLCTAYEIHLRRMNTIIQRNLSRESSINVLSVRSTRL